MKDDKTRQLENRIDSLESTIEKMMPSRRDALKMGGAALAGGSLMAGTASADTVDEQVGTIGGPNKEVDLVSEDIDNSNQITTKDLVVNGTATGAFGGAPVLEAGDTITVASIELISTDSSLVTLYDGTTKDVLGGVVKGLRRIDFLYTFSDNTTLSKNVAGSTSYNIGNLNRNKDQDGTKSEVDLLPPALDVKKIEVGNEKRGSSELGAEVLLKD